MARFILGEREAREDERGRDTIHYHLLSKWQLGGHFCVANWETVAQEGYGLPQEIWLKQD